MHHLRVFFQLWFLCIYLIRLFQKLKNMFKVVIFTLLFSPCLTIMEIDVRRACGSMCWFVSYVYSSCQQTLFRKKIQTFTLHALKVCACSSFYMMTLLRSISNHFAYVVPTKNCYSHEHIMSAIYIVHIAYVCVHVSMSM